MSDIQRWHDTDEAGWRLPAMRADDQGFYVTYDDHQRAMFEQREAMAMRNRDSQTALEELTGNVRRWDCVTAFPANSDPVGDMEERPGIGDYVLFSDHERAVAAAVAAEREAVIKEVVGQIAVLSARKSPFDSDADTCPDCRGAAINAAERAGNPA